VPNVTVLVFNKQIPWESSSNDEVKCGIQWERVPPDGLQSVSSHITSTHVFPGATFYLCRTAAEEMG
jgi:hypothetical protein